MKTPELKKNIALSTVYQILAMIIPLITAPYASRVLGVDGIGIYSYTHSYSMIFALFGALGTVSYGSREIARNRNDRDKCSQLFWEIAILTITTSFICILTWGIWTVFRKEYQVYYIILTVSLLATMFDISWLYAGLEQFKYTVSQNLLFKTLGVVAIFAFVHKPDDLWKYVLIFSLTQTLANISMWVYLPRFVDRVPLRGIRLKKHFKETLVYFIPTIAISVYTILDKTLIGLITHDTSENGNYEQATKIINISKTLAFAGVNVVLQSRISYLFAEHKNDEIKKRIIVSLDYVLFMSVGIMFGLIGIADRFVPVFFGKGYDETVKLLKYMAPIVFIVGISNCLGSQYYNPAGLRAKSARYIVIGAFINLCLNLLLIPHFKSSGAVLATLIAEISISFLYLFNCEEYYSFKSLFTFSWKKIVAGLFMAIVVSWLGNMIYSGLLSVVVQIAAGVTVYCIILLVIKDSFIVDVAIPQLKGILNRKRSV